MTESDAQSGVFSVKHAEPIKESDVAKGKPQIFPNIVPAQWAKLLQKANAAGMQMSGNMGRATRMGVEVAWNYSEPLQRLELTCLRSPFFMSADDVNEKLRGMVNETLAS